MSEGKDALKCAVCGKKCPTELICCSLCKSRYYCSQECLDKERPTHRGSDQCLADAHTFAEFLATRNRDAWKTAPIPGPEDGIEVCILVCNGEKRAYTHTERISRDEHKRLLCHPASLVCPLPSALGFPLVVAPLSPDVTSLAPARLFQSGREDGSSHATVLLASPRTGFGPGTVCGTTVVLRSDGVGFTADPEWARLDEAMDKLLYVFEVSSIAARLPNGLPTPSDVAEECRICRESLRDEIADCGMEWRGLDVSPEDALALPWPRPCRACNRPNAEMWCSSCHSVAYCSAECQRANWKVHKPDCSLMSAAFNPHKKSR